MQAGFYLNKDWRCVTHTKLVSLRNKLRLIRLVWVTAVALQLLSYKLYLWSLNHSIQT